PYLPLTLLCKSQNRVRAGIFDRSLIRHACSCPALPAPGPARGCSRLRESQSCKSASASFSVRLSRLSIRWSFGSERKISAKLAEESAADIVDIDIHLFRHLAEVLQEEF